MVKYVSTYLVYTLEQDQHWTCLMMFMRFFSNFLYKSICCGYSFELHQQVDAIQIGTHNICLYKSICCGYSFELHRQVDAIQMDTLNMCLYNEVDKTYTGYCLTVRL